MNKKNAIVKNTYEAYFELLWETWPDNPRRGAIRVTDGIHKLWLPKSPITFERIRGNDIVVVMPGKLAKEKGII